MRPIKNQSLAQLLMQLRFTPESKRRKQLDSAEKLFSIIDRDKEYPFDFVVFRITGFHLKSAEEQSLIDGQDLLEDLRVFISKLSGPLARPLTEETEKVYTVEQLAETLGVSTKTIRRWQKRGLIGRKFLLGDGTKRIGFVQSKVDGFVTENPELVRKAASFAVLTEPEQRKILRDARRLASTTDLSRHQVIDRIAARMGRAHETIRYRLLEYEREHAERPIFGRPRRTIDSAQAAELYRMYRQGVRVKELMGRFNLSKSSIYRAINQRRAKALLIRKIEFIDSDEFIAEPAADQLLGPAVSDIKPAVSENVAPFKASDRSLPEYLEALKDAPVLTREQELELFRRYNYLKYLACMARVGMRPNRAASAKLTRIEKWLAEADQIKRIIIEANLRLVVSIARRHTISGANLPDLVSEGNISLMRAVEKFDYRRGFRFNTYASWSIAKDFARRIPAESARRDRTTAASLARVHQDLKAQVAADFAAMERVRQSLAQVVKNELNEREQYVILNRFGPVGLPIKRKTKTLKQIGDDLGLTKEWVRQLELVALQKLRQSLSAEEFELLTG